MRFTVSCIASAIMLVGGVVHAAPTVESAPNTEIVEVTENWEMLNTTGTDQYWFRFFKRPGCHWEEINVSSSPTYAGVYNRCINKPDAMDWAGLEFSRRLSACVWCNTGCNEGGGGFNNQAPGSCMIPPKNCGIGSFIVYSVPV